MFVGEVEYILGQELVPGNDVGTGIKHALSETRGFQGLGLEVLDHGPGVPTSHEASGEGINVGTKEGNTATIAKGSHRDVFGMEAQRTTDGGTGSFQDGGEILGSDEVRLVALIVSVEWGVRGCSVLLEVEHLSSDSLEWGEHWVSGVTMGDAMVFVLVSRMGTFLIREIEGETGGGVKGSGGGGISIDKPCGGCKSSVLEADGMGIGRGRRGFDILSGTE